MNFLTRKVKSRLWNPNSIEKVEKHIKNYSSSGELKSYIWNWLSNLICEESWFWVELKLIYTYHPHSHLPAPWLRTSECRLPFCFFFINSDTNKNCASFVLLSENLDRTSIRAERPFAQASIRLWRWYSSGSAMLRHWVYTCPEIFCSDRIAEKHNFTYLKSCMWVPRKLKSHMRTLA